MYKSQEPTIEGLQLVIPAPVVVFKNTVFVADKYGRLISYYRGSLGLGVLI